MFLLFGTHLLVNGILEFKFSLVVDSERTLFLGVDGHSPTVNVIYGTDGVVGEDCLGTHTDRNVGYHFSLFTKVNVYYLCM